MSKPSSRALFVTLLLPAALCSLFPLTTQAAENGKLTALVAQILEREGVIAPGTAPSTRTAQLQTVVSRNASATDAAATSTSVAIAADGSAASDGAPVVTGIVLIFADAEAKEL